jgi:DNA-binding MarR family transcriptional regulator
MVGGLKMEGLKLDKWVYIIEKIDGEYPSNLAKELNITYSHVVKILKQLVAKGWVKPEKSGRIIYYHLTDKGVMVSGYARQLIILLKSHS